MCCTDIMKRCCVLFLVLFALPGTVSLTAAEIKGNASAARSKLDMCTGCHGIPDYKAAFPEVYRVPLLGGQSEKYLVAALNAYKKGERTHPSMVGIARGLSDQDIANLAAYYALQK